MDSKFYVCIVCTADSKPEVVDDEGFETLPEARAAVKGFELAKTQTELYVGASSGEFDQLEEFYAEVFIKVSEEQFKKYEH